MDPPSQAAMDAPGARNSDAVAPPPQAGGSAIRNCVISQLRKTRLCKYSPKGTCKYGSQCTYAHSETELHASPDLSKTRLCTTFQLEGWCNDASCMFAHGEDELRSTNMFYRKTLCIWNERGPGHCRNGDKCRFAHGREQLQRGPEDRRQRGKGARQARTSARAAAEARPEAVPEARPDARGAAAGPAGPAGPPAPQAVARAGRLGSGGLICDSPMKVYPVSPSGDEHPASVPMTAAAYAAAAAAPSPAENLAQQLESLCQQITALTVQCSRMSAAGGGGAPYPRLVGRRGVESHPLFPIYYDSRGELGGVSAAMKPCG